MRVLPQTQWEVKSVTESQIVSPEGQKWNCKLVELEALYKQIARATRGVPGFTLMPWILGIRGSFDFLIRWYGDIFLWVPIQRGYSHSKYISWEAAISSFMLWKILAILFSVDLARRGSSPLLCRSRAIGRFFRKCPRL
jgi:hypothetical protein